MSLTDDQEAYLSDYITLPAEGTKPCTDALTNLFWEILTCGRNNIMTKDGEVMVKNGNILWK